ncbi:MAG: mechanosensitive ion channel family protein [Thermodesulfobacteriota bacterium]
MNRRVFRKNFARGLLIAGGTLLLLLVAAPGSGETLPTPKKEVDVTTKDLKELVDLLENPERREAFTKDLKNLIQLREAAKGEAEEVKRAPEEKEREVLVIEKAFIFFQSLFKGVLDAAASTASLVGRMPGGLGRAKAFLSKPENLSRLLRLLGAIAGGIVIALIVGLLLRRYAPIREERERSFPSKLSSAVIQVFLSLAPYAALLVSLFVLFEVFPSFPLGHTLTILIFVVVFFYRLALAVFSVLLAPEDGTMRILPLSDESANYFWVWAVRFTNYTVFYFIVTKVLLVVGVAGPSLLFIRGILLIIFPLMISIFILQIAREIRMRYETPQENPGVSGDGFKKLLSLAVRFWPIPVLAYSWTLFLFLVTRYETGFGYLFGATLRTAITLVALFLALRLIDWAFQRLFAVGERIKARFPGLEQKTNQYILFMERAMGVVAVVFALGFIVEFWGMPVSAVVTSRVGSQILLRAIAILITVGVVVAIVQISQLVCDRLLREGKGKKLTKKKKTFIPLINTTVKIAAAFIGGIVVLDQLGVNTRPILAGAGIVGLAVGFGAQTLVKDVINGLFILLQDLISVGDVAVFGDKGGLVEAVGLRTVTLRDLAGNVHVIPNSSIETVTNMTKGYSRYVFDVGVAYREDVDEVMDVLREIGREMQNDPEYKKDIREPLEILGVDRFDDSAVIIKARITTKPIRQWAVGREFNRRMKKAFDQRGIEIPFPHHTIYMGEPKEGRAPALQVHLQETDVGQSAGKEEDTGKEEDKG